ncbi:MAG: OmpA family protein [Rickettsiales bacterium]|jgi:chemotaxis protein MotB|nr:OmpA family protein [Rickettsiales bacterium]
MRFREHDDSANLWPSFVDVMSNMFVLMLFIVVIFMITNFLSVAAAPKSAEERIAVLEKAVAEKERVAERLIAGMKGASAAARNAADERAKREEELYQLYDALDMSRQDLKKQAVKNENMAAKVAELNMFILQMEGDIIRKENQIKALENNERNLSAAVSQLSGEMRKLNDVFEATDKYIKWQKVQIVEMGKKLNRALANKTAELYKVRSSFFEGLMQAVAGNENFQVAGDRFVIPSEVFFKSESADIGAAGEARLRDIARVMKEAMVRFPDDAEWILRVDGHTDATPVRAGSGYASNWELSVARAVSVVNFLIAEGIPPGRLAATGFGEHHPIDKGAGPAAMAKNRRIEFKLTEK